MSGKARKVYTIHGIDTTIVKSSFLTNNLYISGSLIFTIWKHITHGNGSKQVEVAYIRREDVATAALDEYVPLKNPHDVGFEDEDGLDVIEENVQQDGFIDNDGIDFDCGVNVQETAPFEVPIVSEGFATANICNRVASRVGVDSGLSTSSVLPISDTNNASSSTNEIRVRQIYNNKRELQLKLASMQWIMVLNLRSKSHVHKDMRLDV
ncbi:hypothetical protein FNV43_RR24869 [Rhamnella rubrinervis]|uniref:Uncharacterized protein n=1 Tax=Rhamnella rubrinervis TaxID=2594499 RepID=A0A8K0GQM3_9ROSA|nr:hypothetical protein FNV43_RR24869 [Rhamnella rubrinervis]